MHNNFSAANRFLCGNTRKRERSGPLFSRSHRKCARLWWCLVSGLTNCRRGGTVDNAADRRSGLCSLAVCSLSVLSSVIDKPTFTVWPGGNTPNEADTKTAGRDHAENLRSQTLPLFVDCVAVSCLLRDLLAVG